MCRPRFDVATFIANEDSLDCRGAPARGGTPPAALADCALLLHGIDPIPQRRCCAGGGRGHAGLDQRLPSVAPSESTDSAAVRGFNFTDVLAPAEGLPGRHHAVRARYSDFAICSCGGISQICQWYRVCDAGALRAEPLGHPFILRGHKEFGPRRGGRRPGVKVGRPRRGVRSGEAPGVGGRRVRVECLLAPSRGGVLLLGRGNLERGANPRRPVFTLWPFPCERAPPRARALLPATRSRPIIRPAGCASQLPGPGCEVADCTPSAPNLTLGCPSSFQDIFSPSVLCG